MKRRKGIILAGGTGSRLNPLTMSICKQLLPVYDKPLIYYPLTTLMLSGIRDVSLILRPDDINAFKMLLGDGSHFGIEIRYLVQHEPEGLPQAYIIAEDYLAHGPSTLILGDNIFFGQGMSAELSSAANNHENAIWCYNVADPTRYGIVELSQDLKIIKSIEEKPKKPKSSLAITGLYYLDGSAIDIAKGLKKSNRGEYEIIDVLLHYANRNSLGVKKLGRGVAWFDAGTSDSLLEASNFIKTIQQRQGILVGSPEEVALGNGWISAYELENYLDKKPKNDYYTSVTEILKKT
jgi:glucose-1-phosphate thymidylyltransferase